MQWKNLIQTKPLYDDAAVPSELHRCLSAFDLTLLGIGAIIGAGIFVLTGVAAATKAGPAIMLSFLLAGLTSAFSALSYAELAAMIGGCGSAYGYAYASFGEFIAWIIGWDLLLEYGMSCSTVAIGWSGYANNALHAININLPETLLKNPEQGGVVNLPAVFIVLFITFFLCLGIKRSARFNNIIVFIKLAAIAIFIAVAALHFNINNWQPFLPFGWYGIVNGAALIFFAYIGFDAVSTAAEEAIHPQRDLPIGIIASVVICTFIYIIVSGLLTGIVHYNLLNVSSPVSYALLKLGFRFAGALVAIGAIAGLTTVILVMYYGFTRVFLAMSRDGLLPKSLAKINPSTKTPIRIIIVVGIIMAAVAGFTPISQVAALVNIGTLTAFALVCFGLIILRYTKPHLRRPFKTPLSPLIPFLGAVFSIYLMIALSKVTWIRFGSWMLIGLLVYFFYSRFHSVLTKKNSHS